MFSVLYRGGTDEEEKIGTVERYLPGADFYVVREDKSPYNCALLRRPEEIIQVIPWV